MPSLHEELARERNDEDGEEEALHELVQYQIDEKRKWEKR